MQPNGSHQVDLGERWLATLIYQHMVNGRDREIADRLGSMMREARGDVES
ncbi:hypothetical protein [Streptomyces brasiliensis]|uniref:Uncharacterized protein n=1 Tax=Streptomyces brasiliensis TaxID=1954 RepID=A0A917LB75_9ACTN|nr:hypothetical protein [Streptomyces brasiliensis]GGJ52080.1 hypothetical protein GCM10010121_073710 [Streptomyces brasiliensis]